jgi:hypothetical protein
MTTQLRPLNLGEILDRTAELYRQNFLLFTGTAAIFACVMLFTQMVILGCYDLMGYPNVAGNLQWVIATLSVVEMIVILLAAGVAIAAFNRMVAWVHLGEPASMRGAVSSTFPRLRTYLWLMINAGTRAYAPIWILYIIFFAMMFAVMPTGWLTNPSVMQRPHALDPVKMLQLFAAFLVLGPLIVAAGAYAVVMSLRYSLAMPVCVVEGVAAGPAIKRSIELSKGARGRIFCLGLLVYAIKLLIGMVLGIPVMIFSFKHLGQPLPIWLLALTEVEGFLVHTFIGPIYATGLTLFYYDQRVRKEGFDIVWMMQAAGLSPQAELPGAAAPGVAGPGAVSPENESQQI